MECPVLVSRVSCKWWPGWNELLLAEMGCGQSVIEKAQNYVSLTRPTHSLNSHSLFFLGPFVRPSPPRPPLLLYLKYKLDSNRLSTVQAPFALHAMK